VDGRVKPGQDEPSGPKDQPMRYTVAIEGERNYSAYVPALPGCASVGDTLDGVKAEIRQAIEFHLEEMREGGFRSEAPESSGVTKGSGQPRKPTGCRGQLRRGAQGPLGGPRPPLQATTKFSLNTQ
jgi:predicted RNase H-like HicB family nuclease